MLISINDYLKHMQDEAIFLCNFVATQTIEQFLSDSVLKRAAVRAIEIIGEAAKKIPEDFRQKYSFVDWKKMSGMRDRLIHNYFGVDYYIVYDIAKNRAPILLENIKEILQEEGEKR